MFQDFLSIKIGVNTTQDYLIALAVFVGVLIILKIFQSIVVSRLKKLAEKTKNDFDDTVIAIFSGLKPPFYLLVALYAAVRTLTLPELVNKIIEIAFVVVVVYVVIKALQDIIEYGARKMMTKGGDEQQVETSIKTFSVVIKIVLWSVGLILILGNLGVDVTSLIAGLGIGGIAVALALQNILGDIFASFSILIDKPFQEGDFIKISETDMGTVEKIGIKTTRLRTPDGQQLIVANKELTEARVQNFKRLERRRGLFKLAVIYETPKKKLEQISGMVEEIIKTVPKTEFDRCHFKEYGDYSLNFEVAFYAGTQDYKEYLNILQEVNLKIFEAFNKEGIEFAYPTNVQYDKKI